MDAYFAPESGRIFACFPGAEVRPGQARMAVLVHEAILEGAELREAWEASDPEPGTQPDAVVQAIEAGTGTGKSLGYLVPALASTARPVIVATRTKQLQRQLLEEDAPRAMGILDRELKCVLAKGRTNYLCKAAWEAAQAAPLEALTPNDYGLWPALPARAQDTRTGDREELSRFGEGESELWDKVNARAERCTGKQCAHYEDCHLTVLRQEILEADLVVVNHALLLADRVLRESAFGSVLPDAPVLILDEAHDIEEQLTDSCAQTWTSRAMTLLFKDLRDEGARESGAALLDGLLPAWEDAWSTLLSFVPAESSVFGFEDPRLNLSQLADAVVAWIEAGQDVLLEARRLAATRAEADPSALVWRKLAERIGLAFSRMEQIFAQPEGWVSTLTREGPHTLVFKANPVDVRPFFHQHLRRGFETVILTSATLRDGRGFNGLRLRLGLTAEEGDRAELVESPFDFESQGLLFVPPGLPERRAGRDGVGAVDWIETSLDAMVRMMKASRGRALILFTSRKMLAHFKPRLASACPGITFFTQGDGHSRHALLERFRQTPNAALLGLASFWQGVDLPGEALSLVVVTALPFAPPDDPVLQARIRAADAERPGRGFVGIQVPQMTLKLKQGLGRLIRTTTDRGVVAILDPRLMLPSEDPNGKRYAAQVRAALPPFPLTRDWDEVEAFLASL